MNQVDFITELKKTSLGQAKEEYITNADLTVFTALDSKDFQR
jgi:hypothetical protein